MWVFECAGEALSGCKLWMKPGVEYVVGRSSHDPLGTESTHQSPASFPSSNCQCSQLSYLTKVDIEGSFKDKSGRSTQRQRGRLPNPLRA